MRLIADRGFSHLYPENTVRAVEEAVATADAVAVDVRRCGTGELVVIRDGTVDRVSDREGHVSALSSSALADLDVLGTNEGVPPLSAVVDAVPPGIGLVLRLREERLAADVVSQVANARTHVVIASELPGELTAARAADPTVPRAFVYEGGEEGDPADALTTAQGVDAAFLYASADSCSERLVGDAHASGMMVVAWPVTSRSQATELAALGVDGVVADRWGVLPPKRT
jgi:glycerophosphoryl diester phosphodiesterase